MAVIVPRPPQPQPNLGNASTDQESDSIATPRAVLSHALVVKAVAALPTLSPVLPSDDPEYHLASKRKSDDGDDLQDNECENDAPRPTKKSKLDQQDPVFGPGPSHSRCTTLLC